MPAGDIAYRCRKNFKVKSLSLNFRRCQLRTSADNVILLAFAAERRAAVVPGGRRHRSGPTASNPPHAYDTIRYDTIRDAILTCAQKLT